VSSCKQLKPVDEMDEEESRCVVTKRCMSSDLLEEAQIVAHILPEVEDPVTHPKWSTTLGAETSGTILMQKMLTTLSWSVSM